MVVAVVVGRRERGSPGGRERDSGQGHTDCQTRDAQQVAVLAQACRGGGSEHIARGVPWQPWPRVRTMCPRAPHGVASRSGWELSAGLDSDADYRKWLETEGVQEGEDFTKQTHCTILVLRADMSRNSGYRAVSWGGLQQKMEQLSIAQQWREWDTAKLADGRANEEEEDRGSDRVLPLYVKFHHRGVALHMLCCSFRSRGLHLPQWLLDMAKQVPCQWHGTMKKVDRLITGLAAGASMEHGCPGLSGDSVFFWHHACRL